MLAALPQFNTEVEEVQSAVRELEPWRRHITVPLIIEVCRGRHLMRCMPVSHRVSGCTLAIIVTAVDQLAPHCRLRCICKPGACSRLARTPPARCSRKQVHLLA